MLYEVPSAEGHVSFNQLKPSFIGQYFLVIFNAYFIREYQRFAIILLHVIRC